jgi:hypothetical protein
MTWIRCRDRMPMGEACEVRLQSLSWAHPPHDLELTFDAANVETLRRRLGDYPDWIDYAEWRPVGETDLEPHVYTVKPGYDEAVRDLLRSDKPVPEKLRELMADRNDTDPDTIRAALRRFGFTEQARMLQEECGELVAAVNRYRRRVRSDDRGDRGRVDPPRPDAPRVRGRD